MINFRVAISFSFGQNRIIGYSSVEGYVNSLRRRDLLWQPVVSFTSVLLDFSSTSRATGCRPFSSAMDGDLLIFPGQFRGFFQRIGKSILRVRLPMSCCRASVQSPNSSFSGCFPTFGWGLLSTAASRFSESICRCAHFLAHRSPSDRSSTFPALRGWLFRGLV